MAAAKISHVSEEEENYLRMNLLMTRVCPRAVRVLFDKEFHPSCLEASIKKEYGKLFDLKKKHVINAAQWNLLFPPSHGSGAPNSKTFDVTLMIALLRNLTKLPPPADGYDNLPLNSNTTPTDDLARIKHYRNQQAHVDDGKIKSTFFTTAWEDISRAVKRLGGQNMEKACEELRTEHLDQSTVPWNIRVQINQKLVKWRENDVSFVETSAAKQVLKCAQENSCVTITASSGVGKTATLRHVCLKMADEGYDVLLVSNPQDIIKFHYPNMKTLFVIDDFCGTYSINQCDLNRWEPVKRDVEELIQNKLIKIIVACRLQVFKDEKFETVSIFKTNVCNLLSEGLCFSQTEKKLIAEVYLGTKASDIIQYCDLFNCFPLLCKLCHDNSRLNLTIFFQNPFSVYEAEIEKLKTHGLFGKYCALALCVMFNNKLEEKVLTDEINTETKFIIENTFEACRLDKGTSRLTLLDELDSLKDTFIRKDQGVYKTVHDKLFDFLSYYFGRKMIQCIIKNAHCEFISQRFLLFKEKDMDQFITIVPPKYYQMYIQRMVSDLSKGEVVNVFCNKNMNNPTFRQKYLCYLYSLDTSYQRQLLDTCDNYNKDTILLHCCFMGDIPLIQWCLYHSVDVNMCRFDGSSPLVISSQEGHIQVVKMLLDNKADINKCSNKKVDPLFIACQENHVDVVKLLLDNKADINKCIYDGMSPLFIACQMNHIDIVKLLLHNKADSNKCANDGSSPLFIACQENHKDVANLLIDNKADINKCTDHKTSPLFIACQMNHIDIVQLLLNNKADSNTCSNDGISPLFIACQQNHVGIVKLLLDNQANINKCWKDETSPLFIACQQNHEDIVKLLLDKKADINKCTHEGLSPIFIACCTGHINIVKMLLENGADFDKCASNDKSLLSAKQIASIQGHYDIVNLICEHSRQKQFM